MIKYRMNTDRRAKKISIFKDTLKSIDYGYYIYDGERRNLNLSEEEMKKTIAISPSQLKEEIEQTVPKNFPFLIGDRINIGMSKDDSFEVAVKMTESVFHLDEKVLVLNFANPVHPGGGVVNGATAQEEDLCRRSTLYASLTSEEAKKMYKYNRKVRNYLGSDYMLLSPSVEVFKNIEGKSLEKSCTVAVLTAAAPIINRGGLEVSNIEIEKILRYRIRGMLHIAANYRYKYLVLGAWGCGAFGNDAKMVAKLFEEEIRHFSVEISGGKGSHTGNDFFHAITFAVMNKGEQNSWNYNCFAEHFADFYAAERQAAIDEVEKLKLKKEIHLDAIQGCIFGGAAGDALGYPVEFMSYESILFDYGKDGIQEYALNKASGKALISDDTQMTLFTATGLLQGNTRMNLRGIAGPPASYVACGYMNWYEMQTGQTISSYNSWLCDVPEMGMSRAPGGTCMSAIRSFIKDGNYGTIGNPINQSKGCGGIMRIAPVSVFWNSTERSNVTAAEVAAITHGHDLGYIPAAGLNHILNRIIYGGCIYDGLKGIVREMLETMQEIFRTCTHIDEFCRIIEYAVNLSENQEKDIDNIRELGEGWIAEETLAIAVYCALRHENDFSGALTASVNHSGDSDSTGAVTGNIVGALVGYNNIPQKWKNNLECSDIILEIAQDLCHGCMMSEYGIYRDEEWFNKYMECRKQS